MIIKKRLGDILVESGLITPSELEGALAAQKKSGLKLGKYLSHHGILSEGQIVGALCGQLKMKQYRPDDFPLDMNMAGVISSDIAQKYQVIPLMKKGRLLTLAMIDPLDMNTFDAIEELTNAEVQPVVCTEKELAQLLNNLYGMQSGLEEMMLEGVDINAEPFKEREEAKGVHFVGALHTMVDEVPVVKLVNSIFAMGVRQGASDIHLSPRHSNSQTRLRIDGRLHEMPAPPKSMFPAVIARIKILAMMDITVTHIPQDGRFTLKINNKEINVRASVMPTIYGESMVLRLLDMGAGIHALNHIGMSDKDQDKIKTMARKPYGMILSTGPTGSGKSTSLYSILNEVNTPDVNIITIEDPVEFRVDNVRQIQLNHKAGMTFASSLRAILRQDPDVIMIGEIRDPETATIAVQAAQTGHRVLSTLHTNDSAGAITRLLDMGIESFLISSVLLVSFAQRLMRTTCPYCKVPHTPSAKAIAEWGLEGVKDAHYMIGKGCPQCMNTGFKGRTGVFEVLVNDEIIQDMILKKSSSQEISRFAAGAGKMRMLKDDAADKVVKGITTLEEAAASVMV